MNPIKSLWGFWKETRQEVKEEKQKRKLMFVERTKEGTIIELLCCVLLLIKWVLIIRMWLNKSSYDSGDGVSLLFDVLMTCCLLSLLYLAYCPSSLDLSLNIKNGRQLALLVRSVRIITLGLAVIILEHTLEEAFHYQPYISRNVQTSLFVLIVMVYYARKIKNAGSDEITVKV